MKNLNQILGFVLLGFFVLTAQAAQTTSSANGGMNIQTEGSNKQSADTETPKVKVPPVLVKFETNLGPMLIELNYEKAPISANNFVEYVNAGFYDGLIFHRVIDGFMVQGGGFDTQYQRKATRKPIKNESNNGLKNIRGSIAMARLMNPDSATSQFFINLQDNPNLDGNPTSAGYAVFGQLREGLEVIDKMAQLEQGQHSGTFVNAPNEVVVIQKAYVVSPKNEKGK